MKLAERISKIKELLNYCTNERIDIITEDDEINEKCGTYFKKLFDSSKFRDHPCFDHCYPEIGLYLSSVAKNPTLYIKYEYEWDREGSEITLLLFHDEDAEYDYDNWGSTGYSDIEYSEIDNDIWELIYDIVLSNAKKTTNAKLIEAKDLLELRQNKYNKLYEILNK